MIHDMPFVAIRVGKLASVLLALLAALALSACGGGRDDAADTTAATSIQTGPSPDGEASEPILIKTLVTFAREASGLVAEGSVTGEVLRGSTIGDSPFCPGGTFRDRDTNAANVVDRTFECPDGTLRINMTPGTGVGRKQGGPWKVISGTGAFEGLQGNGEWEVELQRGNEMKGRETFTGTVTH